MSKAKPKSEVGGRSDVPREFAVRVAMAGREMDAARYNQSQSAMPLPDPPPGFDRTETLPQKVVDKIVLNYLKTRGFTKSEDMLKQEAKLQPLSEMAFNESLRVHTNVLNAIHAFNAIESSPDDYRESYARVKRWVDGSLDLYRNELFAVLWPMFFNIFLELVRKNFPHDAARFMEEYRGDHEVVHGIEVHSLQSISSVAHYTEAMSSNEVVQTLVKTMHEIRLSEYSAQLLLSLIEESNSMILRRILNERISLKTVSRGPLTMAQIEETWRGNNTAAAATSSFNQTKIGTGVLREIRDLYRRASRDQKDRKKALEAEAAAARKARENASEEAKKRVLEEAAAAAAAAASADGSAGDGAKQPPEKKSKTEDSAVKAAAKLAAQRAADAIPIPSTDINESPISVPNKDNLLGASKVPLPSLTRGEKIKFLEDIKNRAPLSSSELPSICCYTFLNCHESCTAVEISDDASLVVGCFSDSVARLWDMKDPTIFGMDREKAKGKKPAQEVSGPPAAAQGGGGKAESKDKMDVDGQSESNSDGESDADKEDEQAWALEKSPYTSYVGHSGSVTKASFSTDGKWLLTSSEDSTIRLWSNELKHNVVVYKGHNYPVWDVQFSPLGFYFASGSHDRTARLWNTEYCVPLRMFAGHYSDVDCVQFHPNCNFIATGSSDRSARLWDVNSGKCVRVFTGHNDTVRSLAVSPDGMMLATGGADNQIFLWNIAEGRRVDVLKSHTRAVTSLAFSQESSLLASGSLDASVKLWDVKRYHSTSSANPIGPAAKDKQGSALLKTLRTKSTHITTLKFTPRNLLLAAGVFQPSTLV